MKSLKRKAVTLSQSRAKIRMRGGKQGLASARWEPVFIEKVDILLIMGCRIIFFTILH